MAGPPSANKEAVLAYLHARAAPDLDLLATTVTDDFHHLMNGRVQDREGLFAEVATAPGVGLGGIRHRHDPAEVVPSLVRFADAAVSRWLFNYLVAQQHVIARCLCRVRRDPYIPPSY